MRVDLKVGFWPLFKPIFDRAHARHIRDNTFQVWMFIGQIVSKHEVQVIEDSQEENVSPGQLKTSQCFIEMQRHHFLKS